jgi:hypothetical protein
MPILIYGLPVKKQILLSMLLLLAATAGSYPLEETIVLEKNGLREGLSSARGIRFVAGLDGFPEMALADSEYGVSESTDLLLHFNTSPPVEETSRYVVRSDVMRVSERNARFGGGAGVFFGAGDGVSLEPRVGALLAPGSLINSDFSIEFWLYPSSLQDGESVLLWRGARISETNRELQPQELRCTVRNRRLVWDFLNFFQRPAGEPFDLTLTPRGGLIPRSWSHHLVRFDRETGLIEYLVDGIPQAVTHATADGRESPEVFLPAVGAVSRGPIQIAPAFSGFMDELRISRAFVDSPVLERLEHASGVYESRVIDLSWTNSRVTAVRAEYEAPGTAAVFFSYRTADERTRNGTLEGEWIPFVPGGSLPESARGRFFQLRLELYPDGSGTEGPSVSRLEVVYEPDLPPPRPANLKAEPGDRSVRLSWTAVPEPDLTGYLVYYGEKPGTYFGTSAGEGASPIDAGNRTSITLTGLENGKLYYFAVAAYDSAEPHHVGEFSVETAVRPSGVHR